MLQFKDFGFNTLIKYPIPNRLPAVQPEIIPPAVPSMINTPAAAPEIPTNQVNGNINAKIVFIILIFGTIFLVIRLAKRDAGLIDQDKRKGW